jgi:hypothetical protein
MKKHLLTLAIFVGGITTLFSQTIPNGSFENWTSTNYGILQNYTFQSANFQSLQQIGMSTITQTADPYSGSYAVRLDTKTNGIDTAFGFFINGMPCGPSNPNPGGTPYALKPTGFTGRYKCSVPVGDTALVFVSFKKNNVVLPNGFYLKKFYGTQSSYAAFSFSINLASFPDSVVIGAASSNVLGNNFNGLPGSMLQLDSINFKGAANPVNLNGSFENWTTGTYNSLNSWQIQGDSVARSTSAYTGSYAVALQVLGNHGGCSSSGGGLNFDQITTGKFTNSGPPKGGRPYTLQNDSLIGYYKFAPLGGDTSFVSWGASKSGSNIANGMLQFTVGTGGVYKRFTTPITIGSMPDSLLVSIDAGLWPGTPSKIGSKLWVDGIQLKSQALGLPLIFMGTQYLGVYPNPSNGIFNLVYDSEINEPLSLQVFNETGQLVLSQQLQNRGAKNKIDISNLGRGLYILKTEQQGVISTKRVLVQ